MRLLALFFEEEKKQNTMKKILTLLLAIASFATLHAQSREQSRDVILGGNNGRNPTYPNNGYPTYPNGTYGNDRQYQIDQVNREYDAKIQSIRNNPYMNNQEKDRTIRQLERDRQARIAQINRNYNNGDYDNDRPNRPHDNGKHKGWYKNKNKNGKGNRDWEDD